MRAKILTTSADSASTSLAITGRSRRERQQQAQELLDAAADLVVDAVGFIDTAGLLLRRRPGRGSIRPLQRLLGDPSKKITVEDSSAEPAGWPCRVMLQQPTAEAIRFVCRYLPDHMLSRVDVTLALITATEGDAARLWEIMAQHRIQRWHRKRRATEVDWSRHRSLYSATGQTGRNAIAYTRPSKVGGGWCVQIEFRFQTAAACQRAGFDLAALASPADLIRYHCERELRLAAIDAAAADRAIERLVGDKLREARGDPKGMRWF